MQNKNNETIDSTNDTEKTVNESSTAEEKLLALEEQNKKLFTRAKKAEGFTQDSSGNWVKRETPKAQADISEKQVSTKPSDILKADEFKLYRQGYTENEIDLIMHNGGMKSIADEKSPLALGLKIAREQRLAEEASGQVSDKSSQSEVERKYTTEQMRNMKPDELAKLIGYAN